MRCDLTASPSVGTACRRRSHGESANALSDKSFSITIAMPVTPNRKSLLAAVLENGKVVERVQMTEIELPAGGPAGVHMHPVPVVGYVLAGEIRFEIQGEAARTLTAGDAFYEPAGARIARFDNASEVQAAKFVAVYLQGPGELEVIRML